MRNRTLHLDYITRAEHRLAALEILFERRSWADVVREAQEIVELSLKALLRAGGVEVPRIHDVGDVLESQAAKLPVSAADLRRMAEISRQLRRDRELAFYGSEDLTPSEFYKKKDAETARRNAAWIVTGVRGAVGGKAAKGR
jgi:HEPN domain-containing protein